MSEKTVHEIQQAHRERASRILLGCQDAFSEIRGQRAPEEGGYLDRLSPWQRKSLLEDQKREKAEGVRRGAVEEYAREVSRFHDALDRRRKALREELFGGLDSATLAAAASADDAALPRILEAAVAAGDAELAKACFTTAELRGSSEVVVPYLEANPEAAGLYREWKAAPSEEARERQLASVERVVPEFEPGRTASTPRAAS